MELRDPRHTGRPVSFGLPAGTDTDRLFAQIAGAAADLLADERKAAKTGNAAPAGLKGPRR